ncbi:hypothetical protein BDD12DRAFT_806989 [Trichophaea hybrida]|nr:hypothetical protein BDD12DRAFT_806989 [Trichophaea hybrida]
MLNGIYIPIAEHTPPLRKDPETAESFKSGGLTYDPNCHYYLRESQNSFSVTHAIYATTNLPPPPQLTSLTSGNSPLYTARNSPGPSLHPLPVFTTWQMVHVRGGRRGLNTINVERVAALLPGGTRGNFHNDSWMDKDNSFEEPGIDYNADEPGEVDELNPSDTSDPIIKEYIDRCLELADKLSKKSS